MDGELKRRCGTYFISTPPFEPLVPLLLGEFQLMLLSYVSFRFVIHSGCVYSYFDQVLYFERMTPYPSLFLLINKKFIFVLDEKKK